MYIFFLYFYFYYNRALVKSRRTRTPSGRVSPRHENSVWSLDRRRRKTSPRRVGGAGGK